MFECVVTNLDLEKKRRPKRKQKGKGIFSNAAKGIQNYCNAWHEAYE